MSQSLAEVECSLAAEISEGAHVTDGVELAGRTCCNDRGVIFSGKGLETALPFERSEGVWTARRRGRGFGVEDGRSELSDDVAVGPEGDEAGVCETSIDRCALTVAEENLDELEVESRRVESGELLFGVRRGRVVCGHDRRPAEMWEEAN